MSLLPISITKFNKMRRLPIFIASNVGKDQNFSHDIISKFNKLIYEKSRKESPYISEVAYISFVGGEFYTPLKNLYDFDGLSDFIKAGQFNYCGLNEVLNQLEIGILEMVRRTTIEERGDWKPFVFLFVDSTCNQSMEQIKEWCNRIKFCGNIIVFGLQKEGTDKVDYWESEHLRSTVNFLSMKIINENSLEKIISACSNVACRNLSMGFHTYNYFIEDSHSCKLQIKFIHP